MINVERTAIRCLGVTTGCKITVANNSPGLYSPGTFPKWTPK